MPAEEPRFSVAWRGYDRRQVDEYVRRLPDRSGPPVFDVVFRGYDRKEVEAYILRFLGAG
jgi:DivIVA domain-containing protein